VPLLSLSLHSFSPTFKLLSMTSYAGKLLLDSQGLKLEKCYLTRTKIRKINLQGQKNEKVLTYKDQKYI